jgi:predicted transcriptional regulator
MICVFLEEIMDAQEPAEELVNFFKALADENRLKIVGLLAQKEHTVEQLAALLELSDSTTSHHLARLAKAGLVQARTDGHYYLYSLQTEVLHGMAQRLLKEEDLPRPPAQADLDPFERKVMKAFTDEQGRIKAIPTQEKKLLVLLGYVSRAFEPGRRYPEKQVNEILSRYHDDTAFFRRSLVECRLMAREGGGGEYWLIGDF